MSLKSSEIKKYWRKLNQAQMLHDDGEISRNKFNAAFDEFYAVIEPLIENLEDDDNE